VSWYFTEENQLGGRLRLECGPGNESLKSEGAKWHKQQTKQTKQTKGSEQQNTIKDKCNNNTASFSK
jgi:hypothetical protein